MVERKKARNLRTSDDMRTLLLLGSIAGVVLGARHFVNYLSEQRKNAIAERRSESRRSKVRRRPRRTAQQVSPRRVSRASPRSVTH